MVSGPSHGSLSLNADGSFTCSPDLNFSGTGQFTYSASDRALTSNTATVTITVSSLNDPPVALADDPLLGVTGSLVRKARPSLSSGTSETA